ncbi:hypothetical protein C3432_00905 [Citrobacter amalonaticus]|uniref:Uncharacterized protein n=1 Tax=Citrobacter amalonaticus TaxID=35703 RepID=A0A2S4S242_CITAM|nr:hypothetical protein C3432_00905 [Citrobacter amalonaticus]POT77450.1 hypothetical protein C3436_08575 [Citrobacter amalonaticus]POU67902.1 hypothetical protein C3430_02110 [Citrobacter amalonaticus]POV07506.1 hypothetical protein C3424_02120 [Citrobacter amalonaticus]
MPRRCDFFVFKMLNYFLLWYNGKRSDTQIREFREDFCKHLIWLTNKKRPNTIPVFGPGKWLLGESRALKVGINAG